MITAFVVAACSAHTPTHQPAAPTGRVILNTTTVAEIVTSFTKAGLPVPNVHDVTASKCPPIGCIDAIDSDTVSIIKFPSTGAAQRFAGSTPDMYLIEDVVLVFTQAVRADQRDAYQRIARTAVAS